MLLCSNWLQVAALSKMGQVLCSGRGGVKVFGTGMQEPSDAQTGGVKVGATAVPPSAAPGGESVNAAAAGAAGQHVFQNCATRRRTYT